MEVRIKREAKMPYITQKFASRNIQTDETVIKEIIHLSGGHPQDTMFLCSEIHYALLETGYRDTHSDGLYMVCKLCYNQAKLNISCAGVQLLRLNQKGSRVKFPRGPATVMVSRLIFATGNPGRHKAVMNLSQETCLCTA